MGAPRGMRLGQSSTMRLCLFCITIITALHATSLQDEQANAVDDSEDVVPFVQALWGKQPETDDGPENVVVPESPFVQSTLDPDDDPTLPRNGDLFVKNKVKTHKAITQNELNRKAFEERQSKTPEAERKAKKARSAKEVKAKAAKAESVTKAKQAEEMVAKAKKDADEKNAKAAAAKKKKAAEEKAQKKAAASKAKKEKESKKEEAKEEAKTKKAEAEKEKEEAAH